MDGEGSQGGVFNPVNLNLYGYVGNNPVNAIDPDGRAELHPWQKLGAGDWYPIHRMLGTETWNNANLYNLSQSNGSQEYTSLKVRSAFYSWFADRQKSKGSEVQWPALAHKVVNSAIELRGATLNGELKNMIDIANSQIFNDAFPKLATLENKGALVGSEARKWDMITLSQEQALVQPIYIRFKGTKAFEIYESAVRQQGTLLPDNYNLDRVGGLILGLGRFDYPDLANPRDRWRYGMREMNYGEYNRQDMPTP